MDQIRIKLFRKLLSKNIDKLKSKKAFIEAYVPIYEQNINKVLQRKLHSIIRNHDALLKPLELATLDIKDYSDYHLEPLMKKMDEKVHWKKRAVLQSLKRKQQKDSSFNLESLKEEKFKAIDLWRDLVIKASKDKATKQYNALDIFDPKKVYKDKNDALQQIYEEKHQILKSRYEKRIKRYTDKQTVEIEKLKKIIAKREEQLKKVIQSDLEQKSLLKVLDDDAILKIDELSMHFGGLKAVDQLSFSVKEGEIFGLIGPNGAGKTTVFNCITQFYRSTSGQIYYKNNQHEVINLGTHKVHDVIKQGIVRTFQNVELIWELSVLGNMLVGAHSTYKSGFFSQLFHTKRLKMEEAVSVAKAHKILEDLGIIMYKDFYPLGLPYGTLKKIELARTLMTNPNMIILDEPAAGLNENETNDLAKTIRQIQKTYGCTIFLVEHDMQLVMDICDTVCAISFGKMLAIGTPDAIKKNKLVQEAYLGGE